MKRLIRSVVGLSLLCLGACGVGADEQEGSGAYSNASESLIQVDRCAQFATQALCVEDPACGWIMADPGSGGGATSTGGLGGSIKGHCVDRYPPSTIGGVHGRLSTVPLTRP